MPYVLVFVLNMTVNYLLLLSAAGMCAQTPGLLRSLSAACAAGVYAVICLLPGLAYLGTMVWRLILLAVVGIIAFGLHQMRGFAAFGLLSLALDGIVSDAGDKGMLICACILCLLCFVLSKSNKAVPVELCYKNKKIRITALKDTGNLLRDPITDSPVLVIGADAAKMLTGLTVGQLKTPLETMGTIPGLRLIPYKAVGGSGFLLALKLENVRIGTWRGSRLVAFAPEGLGGDGRYEALTGGIL